MNPNLASVHTTPASELPRIPQLWTRVIKRMIEQKMAGETGVASMLGTRRSSVIRSRALKAAMLGTIETAVEVNEQEMKKKSRACSIL